MELKSRENSQLQRLTELFETLKDHLSPGSQGTDDIINNFQDPSDKVGAVVHRLKDVKFSRIAFFK